MKFKATDEQVIKIAVNAIQASHWLGPPFKEINCEKDISIVKTWDGKREVSIDYFRARMVKLLMIEVTSGEWEVRRPEERPHFSYQAWASTYPTVEALVNSVLEQKEMANV